MSSNSSLGTSGVFGLDVDSVWRYLNLAVDASSMFCEIELFSEVASSGRLHFPNKGIFMCLTASG